MLNRNVSLTVRCFAIALGFPEHYFTEAMDTTQEDSLSQLRLLHYPPSANNPEGTWRAGLHTDVGCLTLLFQRDGEDGLEVCPGRQSADSTDRGETFFPVPAETGPIVVNIGDMLSMTSPTPSSLERMELTKSNQWLGPMTG